MAKTRSNGNSRNISLINPRGIDVGAKYEIYTIINQLASNGCAILMISSELPELLGMCDRIYVINDGQVVGCLDKDQASQESIMKLIMRHQKEIKRLGYE